MVTIIEGETYEEFRERTEKEYPKETKTLRRTLKKFEKDNQSNGNNKTKNR